MKDLMDLKDLEKAVLIDYEAKELYFFEYFGKNNEFNCIFPLGNSFDEGEDYTKTGIINIYHYSDENFLAFSELNLSERKYIINTLNNELKHLKESKLIPVSEEYFEKVEKRIKYLIEDIYKGMSIKNFILEAMQNGYKDFVIYNDAEDYNFPHIELFSITDIIDNEQGFMGNLLYLCNHTTGEYAQHSALFEEFIEDNFATSSIIEDKINDKKDLSNYPISGIFDFTCSFEELEEHCDVYGFNLCLFEELDKNYQEEIKETIIKRNSILEDTVSISEQFLWDNNN